MKGCFLALRRFSGAWLLAVACVACTATPVRAGIVNGNFETGDFTGWDVNSSVLPPATPMSAAVTTFNGSQMAQFEYAGNQAALVEGSISQDFTALEGQFLHYRLFMRMESDAAVGQPSGQQQFTGRLTNLDTLSELPFVTYTTPGTGPFLAILNFGTANINTPLSAGNYRLRFATRLENPTGPNTQFLMRLDNVRLVPEPSTWLMSLVGFVVFAGYAWRRSRSSPTRRDWT